MVVLVTHQRRRGLTATVWHVIKRQDARGNTHKVVDEDASTEETVWIYPQRGAKAELPGQQHINVVRIGTAVIEGVDLWSRVEMLGKTWDVAAPPSYHHGTRHTRHYSIDLRERP